MKAANSGHRWGSRNQVLLSVAFHARRIKRAAQVKSADRLRKRFGLLLTLSTLPVAQHETERPACGGAWAQGRPDRWQSEI
jgi:hypothetical protein